MKIKITRMSAVIFTSVVGDYATAKYITLGFEHAGEQHALKNKDITTSDIVISVNNPCFVVGGDRLFAIFEATGTTETYEVVIQGEVIEDKQAV